MDNEDDIQIEEMPEESPCRLCLMEIRSDEMTDIFHRNNKTPLKIMACTSLEVHKDDALPHKICSTCNDLLTIFYAFRKKCKSSDTKYRRFLRLQNIGKVDSIAELSDDEGDEEYAVALTEYNEKQNQVLEVQIRDAEEKMIAKYEKEKQALLQEEKLRVYREEKQKIQENAMRQIVATLKQNEKHGEDGKSMAQAKIRLTDSVTEEQDDNIEVIWTNEEEEKEGSEVSHYSVSVLSDDEYRGQEMHKDFSNEIEENSTEINLFTDPQPEESAEYEYVLPEKSTEEDNSQDNDLKYNDNIEIIERADEILSEFAEINQKSEHIELETAEGKVIYLELEEQQPNQDKTRKYYDSMGNLIIFKCSICPKTFAQKDVLKNHEKSHDQRKGYSCVYCEKWFSSNSSRLRHERIHTGEKPFECHVCGKKFVQKEILKRHIVVHSSQKPFQCGQCDKQFTQKEVLRQHINRKHTENPIIQHHKCFLCPKEFRHASGLSRHLLSHAGRTFPCTFCGKNFGDKSALKRHMNTIHKEKRK